MHPTSTKPETLDQVPFSSEELPTSPEWVRLARVTCEEMTGAWEASLNESEIAPVPTMQPDDDLPF